MKRLLVFHSTIAPYRVDFFNDLNKSFVTKFVFEFQNVDSQTYNSHGIKRLIDFTPHYMSSKFFIGKLFLFLKIIKSFNPDLILTNEFGLFTIASLFLKKIKNKKIRVIVISDDSYSIMAEGKDFSLLHKYARKIVLPWCDNIVTPDLKGFNWYKEKYNKGLFFPIICDEIKQRSRYRNSISKISIIEKEYDLRGKRVFLYVGRLFKEKNVETIIKSFTKVSQKDNVLVIIGCGPEMESLKNLSKKLNVRAIFLGRLYDDNLFVWYSIAKCFVLASTIEPFGAVTNEALVGGCYGLISQKAGSSCLIDEGKNGMTFDPYNYIELAEKINVISGWPEVCMDNDGVRRSLMIYDYYKLMKDLVCALNS